MHPLARKHLLHRPYSLKGSPGSTDSYPMYFLNQNINYFSDSNYRHYSPDINHSISKKYLSYLEIESSQKQSDHPFLNASNLLFFGTSFAIDLLIRAFCEPHQDSVLICSPTFPLYRFCTHNHGANILDFPLQGENLDSLRVSEILSSTAKILFLPIPNNPIGSIPCRNEVLTIVEQFKGIVVLDEAYIEMSSSPSFLPLIHKSPNLVILRSFSKSWGLAGIRAGVVIAHQDIIETLSQLIPPCYFPSHTQEILDRILNFPEKLAHIRSKVDQERDRFKMALAKLSFVKKIYKTEANFISIEVEDAIRLFNFLKGLGFLIREVELPNTLRISFGTEEVNTLLIDTLKGFY